MPRLRVQVRDLHPGDICVGSRTEILSYPSQGLRTPAGKFDLRVRRANGKEETVTWGRYTEIGIARPVA